MIHFVDLAKIFSYRRLSLSRKSRDGRDVIKNRGRFDDLFKPLKNERSICNFCLQSVLIILAESITEIASGDFQDSSRYLFSLFHSSLICILRKLKVYATKYFLSTYETSKYDSIRVSFFANVSRE